MATKALKTAPTTATTSVAVRKPTGGSIVSVQDALKAQIAELANRTAPASGNKIRCTQDKKFVLPDGTKTEGPLELVIVDFVATNNFYDRPFDKEAVSPPACYSMSVNPKDMAPYGNSPAKQSADCQQCPNNAWNSGANGKGKACSNGRMLAVLPPDADADTPLWLLQVSPTAIKAFDAYVQGIARTFTTMPLGVVTTVSFDPNNTYASVVLSDPTPNANIAEHFARQAEAREMLLAEKDVSGYEPVAAPKRPAAKAVRR